MPAERKPSAKMQPVVYETPFAEIPIETVSENTTAVCSIRFGNTVLEVNSGADSVTIENVLRAIKNLDPFFQQPVSVRPPEVRQD